MNKQTKIITYLIAILMLLQPLMVTVAYATESGETANEVVEGAELLSITISDSALYEALKAQDIIVENADNFVDEDNQIEIARTGLSNITLLKLEDSNISDLSGIENFTELTDLDLSGNKLTKNSNLDKLNVLTKLTRLDLSNNQIEDVSNISGLINENIQIDLDEKIRIVDYVSQIEAPDTDEEAEDLFINNTKQSIDLPQILYACENVEDQSFYGNTSDSGIYVSQLKVDGNTIDPYVYSTYIEIKDNKINLKDTTKNKYEIILKVENNLPNNGTECYMKIYRIDTDEQEFIAFKDRNLYKAIEAKYDRAINGSDSTSEDTEWVKGNGSVSSALVKGWIFDPDDLVIIANKSDISNINKANLSQKGISDLTGIEKFTGLSELNLSDNKIINIEPLQQLNENKKVDIEKLNEYIEKLNTIIEKLNEIDSEIATLQTEKAATEDETEIESLKNEIERKELSKKSKVASMRSVLQKIDALDGEGEAISKLLSGYSVSEEIKDAKEKFEKIVIEKDSSNSVQEKIENMVNNFDDDELYKYVYNQIAVISEYRGIESKIEGIENKVEGLEDKFAGVITNGLTEEELSVITNENTGYITYIIDDVDDLIINRETDIEIDTEKGYIYDETKKKNAMAEEAIARLIEDSANDTKKEINAKITALNSKITSSNKIETTDDDGVAKYTSTLIAAYGTKLNEYLNGELTDLTADEVIALYDEDENGSLLFLAQDKMIGTMENNIKKYIGKSTDAIQELVTKIIKKYYSSGAVTKDDYNEFIADNNNVISSIITEYESYETLLTKLQTALEGIDYSDDEVISDEGVLEIVDRLNALSDDEKKYIERLSELTYLDLSTNSISDASGLTVLDTLETLKISENLLKEFDFSKFQDIKELYISKNMLRDVEITELRNIVTLDLSENWIENVDKINLEGMPGLTNLNLNGNRIQDLANLLYARNDVILYEGYKTLGNYLSAGEGEGFDITGQIIEVELGNIYTDASEITYDLPVIFFQLNELKSESFDVEYNWNKPCTHAGLYNDGAKYVLDTTERDSKRQAQIYMTTTASNGTTSTTDDTIDTCTFIVNYMVTTDSSKPIGGNIKLSTESFTQGDVTVTVEGAVDTGSGLHTKAYSFDGGVNWQKSNSKTFTENQSDIEIQVRDNNKNVYVHEKISITNIDRIAPEMEVERTILDAESEISSMTISVKDNSEKLNGANEYKYYLSINKEGEENPEWKTYNPGESFTIGEGLEGTYYMFINTISDEAGNVSEEREPMEFVFKKLDKVAPTITGISGMPETETEESVTLTIEGATDDVALHEHPYSFDGGASWQKSPSKTYLTNTKDIQILVRDASGNVYTHEVLEISKIKNTTDENGTLEYLTLSGITKLIRAYITDDYSNLPESFLTIAGDDKKFDLTEITKTIRVYLSI